MATHVESDAIARSLLGGERKAVLLGNAAAHHEKASSLLSLAQWIGQQTGALVGYLTEAANTVGAQLVGAVPGSNGLHAGQMLSGGLKALLLLHTEPEHDTAARASELNTAGMVVTLSAFKTNLDVSDVLLPVAPFTETSGTFVNAQGLAQSFKGTVAPFGQTRPAWKVLRVLGNHTVKLFNLQKCGTHELWVKDADTVVAEHANLRSRRRKPCNVRKFLSLQTFCN